MLAPAHIHMHPPTQTHTHTLVSTHPNASTNTIAHSHQYVQHIYLLYFSFPVSLFSLSLSLFQCIPTHIFFLFSPIHFLSFPPPYGRSRTVLRDLNNLLFSTLSIFEIKMVFRSSFYRKCFIMIFWKIENGFCEKQKIEMNLLALRMINIYGLGSYQRIDYQNGCFIPEW